MWNRVGRHFLTALTVSCFLACSPEACDAASFRPGEGYLGTLGNYRIAANDSLIEVARRFDLGFNSIVAANPGVDPWIPAVGRLVVLPTAWILPDLPLRPGIVINLPELRLYYFPKKTSGSVTTFPLGIGDQGRGTPTGRYRVIQKIIGPTWHVPESIRRESPQLPKVVPRGPDNPLGSHALRLSRRDLLIHGTNRPWGIGRRSSHGCLRLYPEDIVKLFAMVSVGTRVSIINQPVKACTLGARVFVEVHQPTAGESSVGQAMHLLADKNLLARTDFTRLLHALQEKRGLPIEVTLTP
jgi:L,D-transpeptidase ErfK/SrfK